MSTLPIVVVADLETTSIDVETAGACQVAAVALYPRANDFSIVPLFQTYAKPSAPMSPEAEKIHGITPDKYAFAPTDRMAVWLLAQAVKGLGRPVILSGYNCTRYDYPIINRLLTSPALAACQQLDVMHWAIRRDAGQSYKLVDVFQQECIDGQPESERAQTLLESAHDALADCHMTAMILRQALLKRQLYDATTLQQELAEPRPLALMPHGKYRGVPFNEVRSSYLQWAAGAWTDMAPDLRHTFVQLGLL